MRLKSVQLVSVVADDILLKQRPRYLRGTRTLLGLACVMAGLIVCNILYLSWMNKRKAKAIREGHDDEHMGKGDKRLTFKYMI